MAVPEKHVFVCTQARPPGHPRGSCSEKDAAPVMQAFAEQFDMRGLYGKFGLTTAGCMGACGEGPVVLIYPGAVMYGKVKPEDVKAIIDEHLIGDQPIERLKVPDEIWG